MAFMISLIDVYWLSEQSAFHYQTCQDIIQYNHLPRRKSFLHKWIYPFSQRFEAFARHPHPYQMVSVEIFEFGEVEDAAAVGQGGQIELQKVR